MSERAAKLRLEFADVYGDPIREQVDIMLRNETTSETLFVRVDASRTIVIANLLGQPRGLYRVSVSSPSYLPVSFLVNVSETVTRTHRTVLAVNPSRVLAVEFPGWGDLPPSVHALLEPGMSRDGSEVLNGQALYESLDDLTRATLLNVTSKMARTGLPGGLTVMDHLSGLREIRAGRLIAGASATLRDELWNGSVQGLFRQVSGSLHFPPEGFSMYSSFRTQDRYANLQMTLFVRGTDWIVEADIDDQDGLVHVFNLLSSSEFVPARSGPYAIHQILLQHQEIDPGYRLVTPSVAAAATRTRRARGRRS